MPSPKDQIKRKEWIENLSQSHKGLIVWNKGKIGIYSEKTLEKMSKSATGRTAENNLNWKGGITELWRLIRNLSEMKKWRKQVFERDDYICQECFKLGGKLEAHHRKFFNQLLKEFLQQYNQFSPLEEKEILVRLAITYEPFWEIDNGQTLCKECHRNLKKSELALE